MGENARAHHAPRHVRRRIQKFADLFAEKLRELGVGIRLGVAVKSIKRDQMSGSLTVDGESFDKVLVTSSPSLMAKLCPDLPESYLKGLLELKSMGAVVMTLSLKHSLSKEGYYWFNVPKEEGYPFLALVEHTNFVPKENFGGDHIVYAGDYLELGHEYFSMSDEQLLERFIPAFQKFNPRVLTRLGEEDLGSQNQLRPACAVGESFEEYS
ncbi:FAD-dependent oxidoreductase [Candidatus Villigracilis affinis]|uniref:FAD-dependent oxidoreductase n=1 Tax=Candidatus Villigracilis affinis TaxID=3140682 RepID=UPI0031F06F54